MRRSGIASTLLIFLSAVSAACGGDGATEPGPGPTVEGVRVAPGADTLLALDDTARLSATALDANGEPVPGVTFSWSSSDQSVLGVSQAGVVRAVGVGSASVTAAVEGVTGRAELAVIQQVEVVTVSPRTDTLRTVGDTVRLTASATDANTNPIQGSAYLWQSSDPGVATVDTTGLVTARSNGAATITAAARGVPGHAVVVVDQQIATVAFVEPPRDAVAGEAMDPAIRVELRDATGSRVSDGDVPVTLEIGTGPDGATVGGTRTVTTTGGVASFSGIWLARAGTGYRLEATAPGAAPDTSVAFTISPAAPENLGFLGTPGEAQGGEPVPGGVAVAVQDEFGNTVPEAAARVSIRFAPGSGDAVLTGDLETTTEAGVARFDTIVVDRPGTYRLEATAFALRGARSDSFSIHLTFADLDVSDTATCARTPSSHVFCWGSMSAVTGGTFETNRPAPNDQGLTFTEIGVGTNTGVSALRPDGAWVQFFNAESGALSIDAPTPLTGLASDGLHFCALNGTAAYCYGDNESGQLGSGDTASVTGTTAVAVVGGHAFTQLDPGYNHTCGVTTTGSGYCWGSGYLGKLGGGGAATETQCDLAPCSFSPQQVVGGHAFTSMTAGVAHACAVTAAGAAYCWGSNATGQLGSTGTDSSAVPVPVDDPSTGPVTWERLSAGWRHTCGVTTDGAAYCWGEDEFGALGTGTASGQQFAPVPVIGGLTFQSIAAGFGYTCGVTTLAEAYCWGTNNAGQLGVGSYSTRPSPARVIQ